MDNSIDNKNHSINQLCSKAMCHESQTKNSQSSNTKASINNRVSLNFDTPTLIVNDKIRDNHRITTTPDINQFHERSPKYELFIGSIKSINEDSIPNSDNASNISVQPLVVIDLLDNSEDQYISRSDQQKF